MVDEDMINDTWGWNDLEDTFITEMRKRRRSYTRCYLMFHEHGVLVGYLEWRVDLNCII